MTLFLHGFMSACMTWLAIASALAGQPTTAAFNAVMTIMLALLAATQEWIKP